MGDPRGPGDTPSPPRPIDVEGDNLNPVLEPFPLLSTLIALTFTPEDPLSPSPPPGELQNPDQGDPLLDQPQESPVASSPVPEDPLLSLLATPLVIDQDSDLDLVGPASNTTPPNWEISQPEIPSTHEVVTNLQGLHPQPPTGSLPSLLPGRIFRAKNIKTTHPPEVDRVFASWNKVFGLSRLIPDLSWPVLDMRRAHSTPSLLFHPLFPRPYPPLDTFPTGGGSWSRVTFTLHPPATIIPLEPLQVTKPTIILGDEFLLSLPKVFKTEVQMDVFPGATLADGLTILTVLPLSSHSTKSVILHFGLNIILAETPCTTRSRIWDMFWMATMKFPNAKVYLALLNFPFDIENPTRDLLQFLNDCFTEIGSFIPRAMDGHHMLPSERYNWFPNSALEIWSLWRLYIEPPEH